MDLNKQLTALKEERFPTPREEKILQTIEASKALCFRREQEQLLSQWEFLWTQLHYTRKRWWAFQGVLLLFAWQCLPYMEDRFFRVRSIGVFACLFIVLMIPELWRNRSSDSTQVEAACLYSLRQIYAARITLFGIVDIALLTLFSLSLGKLGLSLTEVVAQFLLPAAVTACICFSLLCGREPYSEAVSLALCLSWCGAWWLILLNERIYTMIVPPVWMALFTMALGFLTLAVRTAVRTTNQPWEVDFA